MYETGEKLKEARVAKGYTLDDMQQITKIQKRYLTAIEEGHFEVLPGDFYTRAFIKQYGDAVGLNGDELAENYLGGPAEQSPDKSEEEPETYSRVENRGGAWETIKVSLPVFFVIALILAIIVSIYVAVSQTANPDEPMINQQNGETALIEDADEPTEEDETEANAEPEEQEMEVEESTEAETNYIISGGHPEDQLVGLEASGGASWVSVSVDGEVVESGMLSDGQSFEVEFDDEVAEVDLVIGNSPVTNVHFNNQTIEYGDDSEGAARHVVSFTFE